jgi:hypothetical protein
LLKSLKFHSSEPKIIFDDMVLAKWHEMTQNFILHLKNLLNFTFSYAGRGKLMPSSAASSVSGRGKIDEINCSSSVSLVGSGLGRGKFLDLRFC